MSRVICLLLLSAAVNAQYPAPSDSGSLEEILVVDPPEIVATNAFYYYADVDVAWTYYRDTLGLETVVDYGFAKIMRLAESSYLTLVDAASGMHSADEPTPVTLHLVTDEMNRWHEHLVAQGHALQPRRAASSSRTRPTC